MRYQDERHRDQGEREAPGRGKEDGQGVYDHLRYSGRADCCHHCCWREDELMVLDTEFLLYAIEQKQDQLKVKWLDQTRTEITILKRRLIENENLFRLPSVPLGEQ